MPRPVRISCDELVGDDGDVNSEPFCNEYGLLKTNSLTEVDTLPTLFPWVEKGGIPCFVPFAPMAKDRVYSGKYVAYDHNHTLDGEPYCYFMLVSVSVIEDISMTRLFIVKNPKVFKDTVNKTFDIDSYEASASNLSCEE